MSLLRERLIGESTLDDDAFRFLASLVHDHAGIVIRPEKRAMLQGRLAKRMRLLGLSDVNAYIDVLKGPGGGAELPELLNAVTTNVTAFFREAHHFGHLRDVALPAIVSSMAPADRLRLWSAGCSTGQEPYSIAMTVSSALRGRSGFDARILATDLDSKVIAQAQAREYPAEQIVDVEEPWRANFEQVPNAPFGRVRAEIAALVTFKQLNLMERWPVRGPFQVVFCRNVVIYFDKPTQRILFDRFANLMAPGGWIYIGHSESLFGVSDRFELVGKTIYRKRA